MKKYEAGGESEQAWIDAARIDPKAFAPLYERYATQIYRYCYRQTGDPDTADDMTARVFIKAIERLHQYHAQAGATFRSWLYPIARNIIRDQWRRGRFVRSSEPVEREMVDQAPRLEDIAAHRSEMHALRNALGQLPMSQQEIIEFRIAGLTINEVSSPLDLTPSAVSRHRHGRIEGSETSLILGEEHRHERQHARLSRRR